MHTNNNNNTNSNNVLNYLENKVIQLILEYLLCGHDLETRNYFMGCHYGFYKNQIVKLSLVSKRWYERISDAISTNIKQQTRLGIDKWWDYDEFKRSGEIKDYFKKIKSNGKWSLVRVEESIIRNFFDSILILDTFKPETEDYSNKQNIKLNVPIKNRSRYGLDGNEIISDIESFKYLFNRRQLLSTLNIKLGSGSSFIFDIYRLLLNAPFELNEVITGNTNSNVPLVFHTLSVVDMHSFYGELFEMGLLRTSKLSLAFSDNYNTSNNSYNQLLSKICCNSNDQLNSIEITGSFDIGSIVHLNKMKTLELLSFSIDFPQIFRNIC